MNEWTQFDATVKGIVVCREVLRDLQEVYRTEDEATLALDDAARESGYSADHLRRLARDGKLTFTRRGRSLCFRKGDLPRKGTRVDHNPTIEYDPHADARQVAARRNGRQ